MENNSCCPTTAPKTACSTTKKPSCCGLMLKGAFAGGIIMFLYLMASWMLVPWHMDTMKTFKNEKVIAKSLLDNAPKSGVYVLPFRPNAETAPAVDKPFAFVAIKAEGFDCVKNMKATLSQEFLLCLVLAGLLTCLLKKQTCGCPVAFSLKTGLLVALVHNAPNLIWWHFPLNFTLVNAADDVIGITLAGLVISKLVLCCGPKMTDCDMPKKTSCGT